MPTNVHLEAAGPGFWGVPIPIDLNAGVGLTLNGSLGINSVPVSVTVNNPLPEIDVAVKELPEIDVAVKELPKINVGLDPIRLVLDPLRCHFPVNMSIGFSLFGHQVAGIRICGEAQVITEPYVPNPCECGPRKEQP